MRERPIRLAQNQRALLELHLARYVQDNPMRLKGALRKYYLSLAPSTRLRILNKVRDFKRKYR